MDYWIIGDEFLDEEPKKEADAQGYLKELVRCKDCKYFTRDTITGVTIPGTEYCILTMNNRIEEDDYCSRAERARKMTLDEAVESYVRCFGVEKNVSR